MEFKRFKSDANLQALYEALLTIQPTSVEAEKAFSACGLFATKLRSRLNNATIDACFVLYQARAYEAIKEKS